jgi:hypothetical protein
MYWKINVLVLSVLLPHQCTLETYLRIKAYRPVSTSHLTQQ